MTSSNLVRQTTVVAAAVAAGLLSSVVQAQTVPLPPQPVTDGLPAPGTGNGGLAIYVYDTADGDSLTYYLGLRVDDVTGGVDGTSITAFSNSTLDFGVLPEWSTVFATSTAADLRYFIVGADRSDVDGGGLDFTYEGGRMVISTNAYSNTQNNAMANGMTNLDVFAGFALPACVGVQNPCYSTQANAADNALDAQLLSTQLNGAIGGAPAVPFNTNGIVGNTVDFWLLAGNGEDQGNFVTPTRYQDTVAGVPGGVGKWLLTNEGRLCWNDGACDGTTAPIPLPAAAWLLLSGLAGLGAVGRRRRAA